MWKAVLAELRLSLSESYFGGYIKPLTLVSFERSKEGNVATVMCPTKYHIQMMESRFGGQLQRSLERVGEGVCRVEYVVGKDLKSASEQGLPLFAAEPGKMASELGKHNLNPRLTFETYIVGSSNNFAYAAAQGVAKSPGTRHNPLFIYGGVGLGKTHLMQSIGHAVYQDHPDWDIMYISAETFGSDLIASLQNKKTAIFKKKYRAPNILLIDDIQFIAGKEYIQEEFFHTFNELYMSQRQIVLTSDKPPQEISRLEERLSSRFMGGLMVDVQAPDFETRVAILTQKCTSIGLAVPTEVISLLAEKAVGNIRELEGTLQSIIAKASSQKREIDGELIREHFGVEAERRTHRVRPQAIINAAAQYFNFKVGELTGVSRKAPLTAARHAAMYLLYQELNLPYAQIGNLFGGRDHTTIIHAVEKIGEQLKANPGLAQSLIDIKHDL